MDQNYTYEDYLKEAFELCKKNFEASHPDKQVQLIENQDYQTIIEKPEMSYKLMGRADGIVLSSEEKIGIFRVWVIFSSSSPEGEKDFEDRIQLYLYLYNTSVAYVMDYIKDTKSIVNPREIYRNESRIEELLEDVRKTVNTLGTDGISVSRFLSHRHMHAAATMELKEEN